MIRNSRCFTEYPGTGWSSSFKFVQDEVERSGNCLEAAFSELENSDNSENSENPEEEKDWTESGQHECPALVC